jgi:hypothetical protein
MIQIEWYKNSLPSVVTQMALNGSSMSDTGGDEIFVTARLAVDSFELTIDSVRSVMYVCQSSDGCNNQTVMKRLLDSLVVEERFPENFYSLINITDTFNNNTAATCLRFSNVTTTCAMPATCRRCLTTAYRSPSGSENICATCDGFIVGNGIRREINFLLSNRTRITDRTRIECQRAGCNSLDNINKIRQASTITFDFDKFFGTLPSSVASLSISVLFILFFMIFQLFIIY